MKIAVIGAAGKAGSLIVKEAQNRGHEVTAVVRDRRKISDPAIRVAETDLFQLRYDEIADCEVVIDAFGAWTPETLPQHKTSLAFLADLLSGKPNRLLVVGGAGSLYVNPQHTTRLMDTADFPDAFMPLATVMGEALEDLRQRDDVNWTYLSPAAEFAADGARTGTYTAGGEELLTNAAGNSAISYADFAIAMVDEAESARHPKQRFTVVSD